MARLRYELLHTDPSGSARAGIIHTDHGSIPTPIFMPVGTAGSVKSLSGRQLTEEVNAHIILSNTYHLFLRPGTGVMQAAGGLHRFMDWNRPILTDSGGYQVFSLSDSRKITEEGVVFQSHIDGSRHLFTPESVMDVQRAIGADIIMAFDDCPPYPSDHAYTARSMELTHRWLDKCLNRFQDTPDQYGHTQNLFPIVQGGTHADLRRASCEYIASKDAPGNAIGGLSVGEPTEMIYEFTGLCCALLPSDRPRYLMGVGTPWDILECIDLGVDMFDCVMPTRNGRNAMLFTSEGVVNIDNKKWELDFSPIDAGIPCQTSRSCTKAYLRHLFKAGEYLAYTLASIQNLSFYLWLAGEARNHILEGDFSAWKKDILPRIRQRL